jgi:hypothetical protein
MVVSASELFRCLVVSSWVVEVSGVYNVMFLPLM